MKIGEVITFCNGHIYYGSPCTSRWNIHASEQIHCLSVQIVVANHKIVDWTLQSNGTCNEAIKCSPRCIAADTIIYLWRHVPETLSTMKFQGIYLCVILYPSDLWNAWKSVISQYSNGICEKLYMWKALSLNKPSKNRSQ